MAALCAHARACTLTLKLTMKPSGAHCCTIGFSTLGTWSISINSDPLPDCILCSGCMASVSERHAWPRRPLPTHCLLAGHVKVADGGSEVVHSPSAKWLHGPTQLAQQKEVVGDSDKRQPKQGSRLSSLVVIPQNGKQQPRVLWQHSDHLLGRRRRRRRRRVGEQVQERIRRVAVVTSVWRETVLTMHKDDCVASREEVLCRRGTPGASREVIEEPNTEGRVSSSTMERHTCCVAHTFCSSGTVVPPL